MAATEAVVLFCDLVLGPGESKSCKLKNSLWKLTNVCVL